MAGKRRGFTDLGLHQNLEHFKGLWVQVLVASVLVTLGRAVAIYPLCALFARSLLKVDPRHQHVLFWGGLRGALALALALSLPEELPRRLGQFKRDKTILYSTWRLR